MRREEKYAGWRPRFKGVIDAEGYIVEYIATYNQRFPSLIASILHQEQIKGSHFITPISDRWKHKIIDGCSHPLYLDLLNLECDKNVLKKIERFVNTYGLGHEIKKPSSDAGGWLEVKDLLGISRLLKERVAKMLGERTGLLSCTHLEWMQHADLFIDLDTKEFVYETSDMAQFALLQIADVISRGLTLANCEVCGAYMTPSRKTRSYCGGTCRKRAGRQNDSALALL